MPDERRTEREAELLAILQTTMRGILTVDEDGGIESFNPAAERMFGYAASEVLGSSLRTILPTLWDEAAGESLDAVFRCKSGESGMLQELSGRRKNGSTFPLEFTLGEMKDLRPRKYVAILQDITNWRAAEEALRRERDFAEDLIETAPVIVLVLDEAGGIVRFNRYFERVTGYALSEVRGKDWFATFLPNSRRPPTAAMFEAAVQDGRSGGNVTPIVTKAGTSRQIEWYCTTLEDGEGRVAGLLAIGQDITERRQLEQEYLHAQKMEAVGRLASGIAHDFNNMMMGIIGCADISLKELEPSHPARKYVEESRAAAKRAVSLARQLLDFSRKRGVDPAPIVIDEFLAEEDPMLRRVLEEHIEVTMELGAPRRQVFADRSQLEQILMNLVVNARDAMPEGGKLKIKTTTRRVPPNEASRHRGMKPGAHVILTVTDDGCGMAEQTRAKVFEPFFTTKDVGEGTGLGLSTVYGIVGHLGGHIHVYSQVGKGTVFEVFLPQQETEREEPDVGNANDVSPRGDETVLVVEDEPLVRIATRHYLQNLGYRVHEAGQWDEAFAVWDRVGGNVDALLVDVMLPGWNGPRIARTLQERRPGLRVLFMSVYPEELLIQQGRLGTGCAFIQKPFTEDSLAVGMREVLDR